MDEREELERRLRVLEAFVAFVAIGQFRGGSIYDAAREASKIADDLRHSGREPTSTLEWLLEKSPYPDARRRMGQDLVDARRRVKELEDLVAQRASLDALGVDARALPLPRFVPVRIWLSSDNDDHAAHVREAVAYLADAIGFESTYGFASDRGSWYFRWWSRSREVLTSEQVVERLQKAERALELSRGGQCPSTGFMSPTVPDPHDPGEYR